MEQVFKDNPSLDICHKTSDGKYFFLKNDAKNYAKNLKDKSVKKLVRSKDNPQAERGLTENNELETLELVPKNYKKMKELAEKLNLTVSGSKAEDFIKAIKEYKTENA